MHWNEVWFGESIVPKLLRAALTPPSWAYTLGWNSYLAMYSAGLKRDRRPHRPIICVGNLTVGGTGKTPLTMHLVRTLSGIGRKVVVSCSGYGSPGSESAHLAPEGDLSAERWGDEASLFRWKLPQVPLIVGRRRVRAAELCHEHFPDSVMLMDDGFQHLPLRKDISILLEGSLTNRRCLPAGPYREPYTHRNRATLVLEGPFTVQSLPLTFTDAATGLARVPPRDANALCALGTPERFFEALDSSGIQVHAAVAKADHAPLQEGNLFGALSLDLPLIVSAKDWVKLRERRDLDGRDILIADYEVEVRPRLEFAAWLQEKLNEVMD